MTPLEAMKQALKILADYQGKITRKEWMKAEHDLRIAIEEMEKTKTETTTDTKRLDWLCSKGAWIAWDRDGETCRVFEHNEDGIRPITGWDISFDTARDAIDAAM